MGDYAKDKEETAFRKDLVNAISKIAGAFKNIENQKVNSDKSIVMLASGIINNKLWVHDDLVLSERPFKYAKVTKVLHTSDRIIFVDAAEYGTEIWVCVRTGRFGRKYYCEVNEFLKSVFI